MMEELVDGSVAFCDGGLVINEFEDAGVGLSGVWFEVPEGNGRCRDDGGAWGIVPWEEIPDMIMWLTKALYSHKSSHSSSGGVD